MLKWELVLHPKPRGLWRPKLEITYWVEGEEWKELNICPTLSIHKLPWAQEVKTFSKCLKDSCPDNYYCIDTYGCVKEFPVKIFKRASVHDDLPKCPKLQLDLNGLKENKVVFECYLEWRPGEEPDYADYVDWFVKHYCLALVEEYERRIREAVESGPNKKVVVSLDDFSFRARGQKEKKDQEREVLQVMRRLKI